MENLKQIQTYIDSVARRMFARGLAVGLILVIALVLFAGTLPYVKQGVDALFIDKAGNVGIGTNDPTEKLDVHGTVKAKKFAGDGSDLTVKVMEVSKSLRITEALKMMVPIGTIMAYGGDVEKPDIIDKLKQQGWLFCDGTEYKITDYPELYDVIQHYFGHGNGSTTFNVPDLRGQFLRGVDHGQKVDPDALERKPSAPGGIGDAVGSSQKDEFKKHRHKFLPKMICDGRKIRYGGGEWGDFVDETGEEGGSETRPTNIYVNWIIKATHEIGN